MQHTNTKGNLQETGSTKSDIFYKASRKLHEVNIARKTILQGYGLGPGAEER